jgi:preprotein translocase subunit YajC|tara:strand:+ start:461 stop:592 length:132 start_codon:yes stop_codon:yes gene_type:complete
MDKKIMMMIMALLMIVSFVFAIWGVQMHAKVSTEETKFHALQA